MHSVPANRLFCGDSVPPPKKIWRRFENGYVSLSIVFPEARTKKMAATFEGSPVQHRLNGQSGVTKDRYRVQGRLLCLLAMEDVHALFRVVSKTQTEFGIKYIPTHHLAETESGEPHPHPTSPKIAAGSKPYLGAEILESTNAIQVNIRVALVKLEDFPAQFWPQIINIPWSIRVTIPHLDVEFALRADQSSEQFQAAVVFLHKSNEIEPVDVPTRKPPGVQIAGEIQFGKLFQTQLLPDNLFP